MFRKILFWSHLASGILASLVILMMSFTGVLLTYERQILVWAEKSHYLPVENAGERVSLEQLSLIASTDHDEFDFSTIVINNHPGAPVTFSAGRQGSINFHPLTGQEMDIDSPALESFFRTTTGIHRWFNLSGESRNTARAITGASNLIFLFLILSGLYLWFPSLWKKGMFRVRLLFRNAGGNSKARDFNWHHVMGFWSALPLIFVVATASVFYYPWANNLVYQVYGETPPVRGRGPGPGANTNESVSVSIPATLSLDEIFEQASDYLLSNGKQWRQISMGIPSRNSRTVRFSIDQGNGGQPHLRNTLILNRDNGSVVDWQPFSSQSPGQQTRSIIRFLHTGEVLGLWGQTIAGLVSLTSLFMVWTGLALAWRRLISPLLGKKPTPQS